jgi:hypothetical protein
MAGVSRCSVLRESPELVPRNINMQILQCLPRVAGEEAEPIGA